MSNLFDLLTLLRTSGKKTQHALDQQAGAAEPAQQPSSVPQKPDTDVFSDYDPENSTAERAAAAINAAGSDGSPSALDPAVSAFSTPVRVIPTESESTVALNATRASSMALSELPHYYDSRASSGDILPYGVKSVWGGLDVSQVGNIGTGTYAFMIGSGVDGNNRDLNINRAWSKSFVSGSGDDTNPLYDVSGRGTHMAGTIAALANGEGVVGVAPGAEIISLKTFDSTNRSLVDRTIQAVNYATKIITENNLDRSKVVINLSWDPNWQYSNGNKWRLFNTIKKAATQGIRVVIPAGDSREDVDNIALTKHLGHHIGVYSVSAMDNTYTMPFWSNFDESAHDSGPPIDGIIAAAPGVGVISLSRNNGMIARSTTWSSAAHVAGLLLMGHLEQGAMAQTQVNDPFKADPIALLSDTLDPDGDGFVDLYNKYHLIDGDTYVRFNRFKDHGNFLSDDTSDSWDAVKAVKTTSGWSVLLQGTGSMEGQWMKWDANAKGQFKNESGWHSISQAFDEHWETLFDFDINTDGIISSPSLDQNGDGFVDKYSNYHLTDGSTYVRFNRYKKHGNFLSDDTSPDWNAVKAVQTDSGWSVLLQGTGDMEGQWNKWNQNAKGQFMYESGWQSTTKAVDRQWETLFDFDINTDNIISSPSLDQNGDGFVDKYSNYHLTDGSTYVRFNRYNKYGNFLSDDTSDKWDAVKAVQTDSGWSVLLQGTGDMEGQWNKWNQNAKGQFMNGSGWQSTEKAVDQQWETLFGLDIDSDGAILM